MKIIPASASRSPIGLRPEYLLRRAFGGGSNSLTSFHNSSLNNGFAMPLSHTRFSPPIQFILLGALSFFMVVN
jgi:hypothetical protein